MGLDLEGERGAKVKVTEVFCVLGSQDGVGALVTWVLGRGV